VERLHQLILERGARVENTQAQDMEEVNQQDAGDIPLPNDCHICHQNTSSYLFTNCGHLCVCNICKAALLEEHNPQQQHILGFGQQPRRTNCPLCQLPHLEDQLMRVIHNT